MGFDQKKKLGPGFTGAKVALPIWVDVMKVAHKGLSPVEWPRPSRVVTYTACAKPKPDGTCAEQRMEFGVAGNPNLDAKTVDSASRQKLIVPVPVSKPAAAPAHGTGPAATPASKADSSGPVRHGPTLF
jgi:membrane carboxypeptidase/penicillin-binding protein